MYSLRALALFLGVLLSLGALTIAAPFSNHTSLGNPALSGTTVRGKYIVTLKHGLTARDLESHVGWVNRVHKRSMDGHKNSSAIAGGVHKTFDNLNAYVGEFDNKTLEQIKSRPDVQAVEEDQLWTVSQVVTSKLPNVTDPLNLTANPIYREFLAKSPQKARRNAEQSGPTTVRPMGMTNETSAPWGLARISHRNQGAIDYRYEAPAGSGTYAYVVDTGLNTGHVDFGGRAQFGYNAVANTTDADVQGHGTHTAGIVGSRTYGVAKSATLVAVKVFDHGGSLTSVILDGYNWAVSDIQAKNRTGRAVINMSLGGGTSAAFNSAVEAAYRAGVVTVVAAGNQGRDVGEDSPASAPHAVTVAAVDGGDRQASYSNYGKAVDIYAPGSDILSTWIGSANATMVMSGTSMACPHVSGLVLYLMGKEALSEPADIVSRIKGLGSSDVIGDVGPGSPNLLAFNGS